MCVRADTAGPNHGSEFEIKMPIIAGEIISRPSSPFASPMPRRANLARTDTPSSPALPPRAVSPRRMSLALQEVVKEKACFCAEQLTTSPSSTPSPKSEPLLHVPNPHGLQVPTIPDSTPQLQPAAKSRPRFRKSVANPEIDRNLATKYPLTFLVAEDNKINRKLLVNMLSKFGYRTVFEAHDGAEAVRQMSIPRSRKEKIDVVLMDLWMPLMDGYEATERILSMEAESTTTAGPVVLAVTADVTDGALERAAQVGMRGFMTKPYKMMDLQRLITEYCASSQAELEADDAMSSE